MKTVNKFLPCNKCKYWVEDKSWCKRHKLSTFSFNFCSFGKEKIISPIGDIKFRVLRKPWFWILLVVFAFVVFYHCGGKLLIVRWTLHLPVPTWLKRVLWGW